MRISVYARFLRVLWNHIGEKEKFRNIGYRFIDKLVTIMLMLDAEEDQQYKADREREAEEEKKRKEQIQNNSEEQNKRY